jgi:hypothetical protein
MRKGLFTVILISWLFATLGTNLSATASQVVFGACFPNRAEVQPLSFGLICSGSIRADGYRMFFRANQWDTWDQSRATAEGRAVFPKTQLTQEFLPPCWKARCEVPMTTRPARIVLSAPTRCWNQTQFNRAALFIDGTRWEFDPWATGKISTPLFCALRPKTRKLFYGDGARRAVSITLGSSGKTAWNARAPWQSLWCSRRARYRYFCRAKWSVGDLGFGAVGTVRSIPTRSQFPLAKVRLRVLRFNYYCSWFGGTGCLKRFRISSRVIS